MKTLLITILLLSTLPTMKEEPLFPLLGPPQEADWLDVVDEPGQSFKQFCNSKHNVPNRKRNTIHLLPMENLPPSLQSLLLDVTAAYFMTLSEISPQNIDTTKLFYRNHHNKKQYKTYPILDMLINRLSKSSFCTIAITGTDLYPEEDWNFVFGMAHLKERVGVFSFNRYTSEDSTLFRKRCVKVITHEIGHMFGLPHCIRYSCNMNGSNSLAESDTKPLYLCPDCLKKLHNSVPFEPLDRYTRLKEIYEKEGFSEEVIWLNRRLETIE